MGVDALLEQQTRSHKDLDAFVAFKDLSTFTAVLGQRGFALKEIWRESRWRPYPGKAHLIGTGEPGSEVPTAFVLKDAQGREVDVHVMDVDEYGFGRPAWECNVSFSPEALHGEGVIAGVPVRCLSAAMHMRTHTGYELQDKDRQDLKLLRERFKLDDPQSSA